MGGGIVTLPDVLFLPPSGEPVGATLAGAQDAPAFCAAVGFCGEDCAVLAPFLPCILAFFFSFRA